MLSSYLSYWGFIIGVAESESVYPDGTYSRVLCSNTM